MKYYIGVESGDKTISKIVIRISEKSEAQMHLCINEAMPRNNRKR